MRPTRGRLRGLADRRGVMAPLGPDGEAAAAGAACPFSACARALTPFHRRGRALPDLPMRTGSPHHYSCMQV